MNQNGITPSLCKKDEPKAYIEYFLALCTLFISEEFGQTSLFIDIAVKSMKLIVSLNTL